MRRWLVLLMIVLLPLRAAAGDAMSVAMAGSESPAARSVGMAPDCPMHAASTDAPADDGEAPASSDPCGSCALCFAAAQAGIVCVVVIDRSVDVLPSALDDRFRSVVAPGLLRPPAR